MTKEPIMIDDVDVSKCEHIDFDCANCEIFANMCHENPNCYYKKLKRKEKECEKYKQALQEIKDYCNKYPQNSIGFKKQILQKCEVIKE